MIFHSTRNKKVCVSGAEAICRGIAEDGGLYVPAEFPTVTLEEIEAMAGEAYETVSAKLLSLYLPELSESLPAAARASAARFDGDPAPLVKLDDNLCVLELWHGPTHAFKDIALTVLPHLLVAAKKHTGDGHTTLIPVATSGDTGKAALEGFKDVAGTAVAVFYPDGGVSDLQRLQMITTTGGNVFVSAIRGNFDDAQTAVKKAFADADLRDALAQKGIALSSANSINFGRLAPQIAYYFTAYADLLAGGQISLGDKVDYVVPSGNFGDILAGYYARKMGLPVGKLICASNRNKVLTDFFSAGKYDVRRAFYKTTSPSMDILVSSNLERLLYDISGEDDAITRDRMAQLKAQGIYEISPAEREKLAEVFEAGYADEDAVAETIAYYFDEYGYIMDPHTAVAACVLRDLHGDVPETPTVVLSTASPHKFAASVLAAIDEKVTGDESKDLRALEDATALPVPDSLINLPTMAKLYEGSAGIDEVPAVLVRFAEKLRKG